MSLLQKDLERNRHSMAHILAQAIIRLYPDAKIGIGPVIGEQFYYEIESEHKISEEDFPAIEKEMISIVKANYPITQIIVSKEEAFNLLLHRGQIYKTEILEEIDEPDVSIYKTGEEFLDLDSGPHVASTAHVGFFKLTRIDEVHWKGKSDRPKMQRVWGVGFLTQKDLEEYMTKQQELQENDHMKIGPKLGFFYFTKHSSTGMPVWLPKGVLLINSLKSFLNGIKNSNGYYEVVTPPVIKANSELIDTLSEHAKDLLFPEISFEDENYILRSDLTPNHYDIFKSKTRSYRDLPFKLYENGQVYRKEIDNAYNGLARTRIFNSERINIFCNEDQVFYEIVGLLKMSLDILEMIGFKEYKIQLTTNSGAKEKRFDWADQVLRKTIEHLKLFSREVDDQTAENGPKIEIFVKDLFEREWQLTSIQLDIFSTVKQNLSYIDKQNSPREVIAIHGTIIGSFERLIALLLEIYGGNLPLYLSPVQVRILPISKIYNSYAEQVAGLLMKANIRVDIDSEDETLQSKIRYTEEEKIPYMLIVGSKEEGSNSVSVRPRENVDMGLMKIDEFIEFFNKELKK